MPRERVNPPAEELYARKWPIFAVTMIGLFMALIDVTIVNITIPTLERELDTGVDTVSWVLNAYNIMFAVLLISMGRLADQFGRRRFFLIGMTIFTLGSLLCALSGSVHQLIGFRVLQGVGAAILAPLALATTALVFPPKQRGLGLALIAVVANAAAALGPPIGGLLVEYASWHWIFLVNVPIGVVGVVLALRVMPESFDLTASQKVDWIGMLLIGASVFCLTYGLVEANNKGWGSTEIVSLFAGAVVLGAAFVASQRYGRFPMVTPALVRNRQFIGACGTFVLFAVTVMGPLFLGALAFVNMWGYSQLTAALAIFPIPGMGLIVAPLVSRRADRVPPRLMAIPAMLIMVVGLIWLGEISATPDYLGVLAPLCLVGIGMGAVFPAVNVGAMGSISGQELGVGSGVVNMSRQVGFAIGVALLVAVFTGVIKDRAPSARAEATAVVQRAALPPPAQAALLQRVFTQAKEGGTPLKPRTEVERNVVRIAAKAERDGFSAGFRVAALVLLLAVPLALTMRRSPVAARVGAAAAAG